MEEQILKIINDKFYQYKKSIGKMNTGQFKLQTTRDISIHILEFIKWKDKESTYIKEDRYVYYGASKTLNELYQYWIVNIK